MKREETLEWFGGKKRLVEIHTEMSQWYYDHSSAGE
jgi:hypothetical protein